MEDALACEGEGQARACVNEGHDSVVRYGRIFDPVDIVAMIYLLRKIGFQCALNNFSNLCKFPLR